MQRQTERVVDHQERINCIRLWILSVLGAVKLVKRLELINTACRSAFERSRPVMPRWIYGFLMKLAR